MSLNSCKVVLLLVVALVEVTRIVDGAVTLPPTKLDWHFYKHNTTCPEAEVYVKHQVELYYKTDKSIAAKLLRLAYSDCFVTGCDASVLLAGPHSERTAPQNSGLGGFILIDKIKTVLEDRCAGVVSCADILQLATRDAVHMAGAPSYPVFTGRRDGSSSMASSVDLPSPLISLEAALAYFRSRGLDVLDFTTLLGGHSLGQTHCSYVVDRLYNFKGTGKTDPSMDASFVKQMKKLCPKQKNSKKDPLVYLNPDSGSSYRFTNSYFSRALSGKSVLQIDQQLNRGTNDTKVIAQEFASGFEDFRKSFALSMARMGGIGVLTGSQGEIRRHCQYTNKDYSNKH